MNRCRLSNYRHEIAESQVTNAHRRMFVRRQEIASCQKVLKKQRTQAFLGPLWLFCRSDEQGGPPASAHVLNEVQFGVIRLQLPNELRSSYNGVVRCGSMINISPEDVCTIGHSVHTEKH